MSGHRLGQQLGELAQLEDRRDGVFPEIALRNRRELGEPRVVHTEECKVASRWHAPSPTFKISKVGVELDTQTGGCGRAMAPLTRSHNAPTKGTTGRKKPLFQGVSGECDRVLVPQPAPPKT